jgi:hypothetical protein
MLVLNQLNGFWARIAAGGGPIEFVGGATASVAGGGGNTTISLSSGLTGGIASAAADGDFVIAAYASSSTDDDPLSITDGSNDYTLIGTKGYSDDSTGFDTNLRVAYKFISGDTSTTFGGTAAGTDAGAMAVYVFRGVNTSVPLDVTPVEAAASSTGSVDCGAILPVTAGAYIVVIGACAHNSGVDTWSTPSDLVDFLTVGSNDTNDVTLGIGHKADWVSGSFNPVAWTGTHGTNGLYSVCGKTIALRSA